MNWVITKCGKIIEINEGKETTFNLRWKQYVQKFSKKGETARISEYNLDPENFNTKTPKLKSVEEAIVSQYPKIVLESYQKKPWYILENIHFSENEIKVQHDEFKLSIQKGTWQEINYTSDKIESMHIEAKKVKQGKYMSGDSCITPYTDDIFIMTYHDVWLIFYRIKKTQSGYKLYSCLLRNRLNSCKDIFNATYGKSKRPVDYYFSELSNSKSSSLCVSKLSMRHGWLDIGVLRPISKEFFETQHIIEESIQLFQGELNEA